MTTRLTISVPDVDLQLAAGFDRIRLFRGPTADGPFVEITAEQPGPATLTGRLAGPFEADTKTLTVRVNRGPIQSVTLSTPVPASANNVAASLMSQTDGLIAEDDGTGRLRISTTGSGTDESLELLGDANTLTILGFDLGQTDRGEAERLPLVSGVTSYDFEDYGGESTDYYQVDFLNSGTGAVSERSVSVQGQTVENVAKQQADSRSPRGLTLTRKTSHVFRQAFLLGDGNGLVPIDASRYPSFQIIDINGMIVSSGVATLDGQAGHYRVEFYVPADALISNDDRRWRVEWLMIDQNNRQLEKTTEFDVRDVEVTATPVRDIKILAMCNQPLRLFIRELHRPYSILMNLTDTSGNLIVADDIVYPATSGSTGLTEVVENETYVYYYDVPAGTLVAGTTYQAIFQIRPTVSSIAQHAFQIIEVPPTLALQYFPALRMCIDKYQKRREILQSYQDSDIYEYLKRGLQVVNGWHPVTSFQMTTLPDPLVPFWLMAGQLWGLNAQYLLETDLQFSFCLDKNSVVRTDRGLVRLKHLGQVNQRALASSSLITEADLALVMMLATRMRGRFRAQQLIDGTGLTCTAQSLGLLLSRVGLSHARQTDHAGGWLWDTTRFEGRVESLTNRMPDSFESRYALRCLGESRPVRCIYDLGEKPCRTVRTQLGYEIVGTKDHAFLALNPDTLEVEWRTIEQLNVGDIVATDATPEPEDTWDVVFDDVSDVNTTQATKSLYRLPDRLTPALARVLGYLVAEGTCSMADRVVFGTADERINQQYVDDFEEAFGVKPDDIGHGSQHPGQYGYDSTRDETDIRYFVGKGVELRRFLAAIGLGYEKSRDKTVPWSILQAPLSLAAHFLRAYFDGDGCFVSDQIHFCSYSSMLRQEIQALLLRFGIVSRNSHDTVTVRQPSLDVYADRIGFGIKHGEVHVSDVTIREALPAGLARRLHTIANLFGLRRGWVNGKRYRLGWKRRDLKYIARRHLTAWWNENRDAAYEIDANIAKRVEYLVEAPIFWQTITNIEDAGVRPVMDPSLHGGTGLLDHGFTAGGFVTHNSGQTVTLDYDHTGNIDTAIQRATDFIREGLGPAKTAIYRRQAGVGSVAGRPYRYSGLHNFVYPISRLSSTDFMTMLTNYGLLALPLFFMFHVPC